jgi:predicted nucleic acid-binding Zn ribbon protein
MERAGDFLGKVMRRLDRSEASLAWLSSAWPTIVGKALASHTRPMRCGGGLLELTADGKPWQQQLESMKREISGRINQAWGANLVREVRFVASKPGPEQISCEVDNEHTPFIRRRA